MAQSFTGSGESANKAQMQYVLKSENKRACSRIGQSLHRRGIQAKLELLIEGTRLAWGLTVAEGDVAAAKGAIWGDPDRADIWDGQ